MTTREFSDAFDTLINTIASPEFGITNPLVFDEYEKSLFLTRAQQQLVISLYTGRNSNGDSFESTEELRRYLEPLVVQVASFPKVSYDAQLNGETYGIKLKDDVMFIIFECVNFNPEDLGCLPCNNIQVQPVTHDEYHRIKNNPFRGPNEHRVLRLDINLGEDGSQYVELLSKYPVMDYIYRYVRKPRPIVLENLENLSIDGVSTEQTSELNEALHDKILELAVQLGLQSKSISNKG